MTADWRGRRVFVTGHTGFKGSWLCCWLQRLGADVVGFSLAPPTSPSMFELAEVGSSMRSVIGDVRDLTALVGLMQDAQPEVVLHLAAQPLVRRSFLEPVDTFATNVMGTAHVLEAVRSTPSVRSVVVVTSDKCYENQEWAWGYREHEPMGGFDPYSSSKGCAELVTAAYRRSFMHDRDVRVATGRAGNVIGGGDWAEDRLIPDMIRSWTAGRSVSIRSPQSVRPWQHVLEPLHGYLMLADRLLADPSAAEGWNFGPADSDARPVRWIVERLGEVWGDGAQWELDPGPHPHEAHHLKLDCSKAKVELGWTPRLDLGEALDWTVEWYRVWSAGGDVRAITDAQIARYEAAE